MKSLILPALALIAAGPLMTVVVVPAAAQTQQDCQTQIGNLSTATTTVGISGKNAEKDREGLTGKLSAASSALSKGKNADAVQKLTDYRTKVEALAVAGRISSADAATLTTQTNDAIACINGIAAS